MLVGKIDGNQVQGAWRLLSFELNSPGGTVHPMGDRPTGYLITTPDGHFMATLSPGNRGRCASENPFEMTDAEKVAAANFLSYAGRYEIEADMLTVFPEVSYFPNWVGAPQARRFRFDGDVLVLAATAEVNGVPYEFVLRWQRA